MPKLSAPRFDEAFRSRKQFDLFCLQNSLDTRSHNDSFEISLRASETAMGFQVGAEDLYEDERLACDTVGGF